MNLLQRGVSRVLLDCVLLHGHFNAFVMLESAVNTYGNFVPYIIPLLFVQDAMQLTLPIMQ